MTRPAERKAHKPILDWMGFVFACVFAFALTGCIADRCEIHEDYPFHECDECCLGFGRCQLCAEMEDDDDEVEFSVSYRVCEW